MTPPFSELAQQYRQALLDDVLPFWERHSPDRSCGGYFTCLDRDGRVYDNDKFVWLQARQVWTFSMLWNRLERCDRWLDMARLGVDFLRQHGRDADGNWHFSLKRDGSPLTAPYSLFSDCFAAMAFAQYALATGEAEAAEIALSGYRNVLRRKDAPKGRFDKAVPGARPSAALAVPMILANLTMELEPLLDPETSGRAIEACVNEIFGRFLDPAMRLLREHVAPDGTLLDCFEGRLVNPGHGIEAMWFMLDIADRRQDRELAQKAVEVALRTLEYGWDEQYEGIFYFRDARGHPPQQLEWDQKLWWVHIEALVATLKGYRLTGSTECLRWFERLHEYVWRHFPDPVHGEWFGYLNRRGEVLLPLKGGKWKGCFHVPRGLHLCALECERIASMKG